MRSPLRSPFVQHAIGTAYASYVGLVRKTTRLVVEPANIADLSRQVWPVILGMWHGQHFMAPLGMLPGNRLAVLISRSRDGEINAVAARKLGLELIRGSGARPGRMVYKGGVTAMREMIRTLEAGMSVALTADVPKRARIAGLGIVQLAARSGRPIVPYAVATWPRIDLTVDLGSLLARPAVRPLGRGIHSADLRAARRRRRHPRGLPRQDRDRARPRPRACLRAARQPDPGAALSASREARAHPLTHPVAGPAAGE